MFNMPIDTLEFSSGRFTLKREGPYILIREGENLLHVARGWTAALEWLDELANASTELRLWTATPAGEEK